MAVFKVSALKKGLEHFGLEPVSGKSKDLEAQLDEHLQTVELGYECPSCKKDIPDVLFCPYCGESFEEASEETAAEPAAEEAAQETPVEEVAEPAAEEPAAEEGGKKKGGKKGEGKPKADKPKSDKPAGRPEGKSKNTEAKEAEFANLVAGIDQLVGENVEKRERKTGVTYVLGTKRILKAVLMGKNLTVEFNVDIASEVDGLVKYTAEEAKAKHLGSVTAVYTYGDTDTALKLVKEALK